MLQVMSQKLFHNKIIQNNTMRKKVKGKHTDPMVGLLVRCTPSSVHIDYSGYIYLTSTCQNCVNQRETYKPTKANQPTNKKTDVNQTNKQTHKQP